MHPKVQWLFSRCTWFHVLSSNSVPLRLVVRNDTAPVSCDERNDQGAIATMMDAEESCIRVHTCSEAFSWETRKLRLRRKVHMYVFFVPGKIRFRVPLHDDGTTDGRRIGAVIPSVPPLLQVEVLFQDMMRTTSRHWALNVSFRFFQPANWAECRVIFPSDIIREWFWTYCMCDISAILPSRTYLFTGNVWQIWETFTNTYM